MNQTASIYIKTSFTYIGLSKDNQTYFTIDNKNIITNQITSLNIIDPSSFYIKDTKNNPTCETDYLLNLKPRKCNFYIGFSNFPLLSPLEMHHGWFYASVFSKHIQLHCPNNIKIQIEIQNTETLQIAPDCYLKIEKTIISQNKFQNYNSQRLTNYKLNHSISLYKIAPFLYKLDINQTFEHTNNHPDIPLYLYENQLTNSIKKSQNSDTLKEIQTYTQKEIQTLILLTNIILTIIILIILILTIKENLKLRKLTPIISNHPQSDNLIKIPKVRTNSPTPQKHVHFAEIIV